MNSGGLTHCFPSSVTEHLSGIIIKLKIISDINLKRHRFNLISTNTN